MKPVSDKWTYEELEATVAQLRKSERGQRALENLSRFFSEGGIGLDVSNKAAVMRLLHACFCNPWDLPASLIKRCSDEPP